MLTRLIYRSISKDPPRADLDSILVVSQRNNARMRVTGALCLLRGAYMQYLEGEAESLQCLMTRIATDQRHTGLVVLDLRRIETRSFPHWSMAVLRWDEEFKTLMGPLQDMGLFSIFPETAATTFRSMFATKQWQSMAA